MRKARVLDRPFASTFLSWFGTANLGDILLPEPSPDQDAVYLHFLLADGALEGWAHPHDLSVGAILNNECRDLVYTDELVAEQSENGWSCSMCLYDPPRHFRSLEELWSGHLFGPFGQWCNEKLRAASGVAFYGDTGMTWAKLEEPEDDAVHFQPINSPSGAA